MVKSATATAAAPAEKAPKCSGSGQPYAAPDKAKAANGDRRVCPVCGGSVGLAVSKRSGAVTYSTHYRKAKGGRTGAAAERKAAAGAKPKGKARADVKAATKFVTASGTEYAFTPAANGTDKAAAQGTVVLRDGKAGNLQFPVYVNEAGEASFRNARQGRMVKGKLA
jgi:hypothetical protein